MTKISKKDMPALASGGPLQTILTWPSGILGFNDLGQVVLGVIQFLVNLLSFLHLPGLPSNV